MTNFRFEVSTISRGKGKSAIEAIAYQTASKLCDRRLGVVFNSKDKEGVVDHGLTLPNGVVLDVEEFWNNIETHHKRHDAVVARELKLSIPKELSPSGRLSLVFEMALQLTDKYSIAVNWAIHAPRYFTIEEIVKAPWQFYEIDGEGRFTNSNWHVHMTLTACNVYSHSDSYVLGTKCEELDPIHCGRAKLENFAVVQRKVWCDIVNEQLAKEKLSIRVDHRSFAKRGIKKTPGKHFGSSVYGYERRAGRCSDARERELRRHAHLLAEIQDLAERNKIDFETSSLWSEFQKLRKDALEISKYADGNLTPVGDRMAACSSIPSSGVTVALKQEDLEDALFQRTDCYGAHQTG